MKLKADLVKSMCLVTITFAAGCADLAAQKKPNFVFIMVDDQAYDLLQSSGRYPFLRTPNLNRLEREGVKFTNYFCAQSLSAPQRASILTGAYSFIHGVTQNHPKVDPDWNKTPSYTKLLQQAGYTSAFVGKIHMANKPAAEHVRPGFDYWAAFNGQGQYTNPTLIINGVEKKQKGYITEILTDYAIDFIKQQEHSNKPFHLCLWHKAVHEPFTPADKDQDLYAGEQLPEPPFETYNETFKGKPKWQIGRIFKATDYALLPDSVDEKKWNPEKKQFLNILKTLHAVDESLGKIFKVLEETKQLDNTVIIYTSDNGYFMGDHTLQDKRLAYDASMRIPLLIRYPKLIKPGTSISDLCFTLDIPVSILDLAGVKKTAVMQGESFVPLLKGESVKWRNSLFFVYFRDLEYPFSGPTQYAVRTKSYKYVDSMLKGQINELYDLEKDPGEMVNRINDPAYASILKEMQTEAVELKNKYHYNPDGDWRIRELLGAGAIVPRVRSNDIKKK